MSITLYAASSLLTYSQCSMTIYVYPISKTGYKLYQKLKKSYKIGNYQIEATQAVQAFNQPLDLKNENLGL